MSETPVFSNPPITEALIDIRATLPSEITAAALDSVHEAIIGRYPAREALTNWEAGFGFGPGGTGAIAQAATKHAGFIYRSSDRGHAVQVKLNGFTFNWLKRYDRWAPFRDEANRLWDLYCHFSKPTSATRIAVRYINRIEIPLPISDLSEYIRTAPQIAPELPQGLSHFLMRLEIPYPESSITAIVTETIAPIQPNASVLPLILDIDVFKDIEQVPESDEIWNDLEIIRKVKNEIFLQSVTKKAQELFQ